MTPPLASLMHQSGGELVHGVVSATGLESSFAREILLVVVAHVGACHILVFYAGDALADFLALDIGDVSEHALLAEIFAGEIVSRERCGVIGRQRDQMMEDAGALGRIPLECPDLFIGFARQIAVIIRPAHQLRTIEPGDVLAFLFPGIEDLLPEVQGLIERE